MGTNKKNVDKKIKQVSREAKKKKRKKLTGQQIILTLVIVAMFAGEIIALVRSSKPVSGSVTIQELNEMIDNDEVESVGVTKSSNIITIKKKDGSYYEAVNPQNDTFIYDLTNKGVNIEIKTSEILDSAISIAMTIPMFILMAMLISYLTNTMVGASTKMFSLLKEKDNNVTFESVKGLGQTKKDVKFIIEQMHNWSRLEELGARPCKGVLLYGPPGNGKTMLAKAIAKEANIPFISASGSDFAEMFVGVGAARIRNLWTIAEENAPCILFIDEIDCLGKRRRGDSGANTELNQTLNALLQRMDGINNNNGILVIAATNRKDDLDPALTRPGRFDKHYYVGAPDNKQDRDKVVEVYLANKKLDEGVTLEKVSKLMVGLSGADIEEALNGAVYISLQNDRDGIINYSDIDEAIMQLRLGGTKKETSSQRDLEVTAIHESAHTLVSLLLGCDVSKVSIIAYSSGVGGVTIKDTDKMGDTKLKMQSEYINDIKIMLAGKIGEEIVYGEHTQGCSNDIEKATGLIYEMCTTFAYDNTSLFNENMLIKNGLSTKLEDNTISKCNKLLQQFNTETTDLLRDNKDKLMKLYEMLLEQKTIVCPTLDMLA